MTTIRPLVLCGGVGARLWPASRNTLPKQFAALIGDRSTFQETLLRAAKIGLGRPLIVTNQAQCFLAQQQLVALSIECDILAEPARRDSGPAIAAGCLAIAREDPEALVLVLPSDHVMRDPDAFMIAVSAGVPAAKAGRLVTFGVTPTHPETGYGYIEPGETVAPGVASVACFAEKPTIAKAEEYVAAGLLWNSGNFLFKASVLVEEYRRFDPATIAALAESVETAATCTGVTILGEAYERAVPKSIDYAVMEKTARAAVVPMSCGWSDIGSWDALWGFGPHDAGGNVSNGAVELLDSRNCYVSSSGALTSVVGLKDIAVITTDDAVLVTERKSSGEIKRLVEQLRKNGRSQADSHSRVQRPWGWYRVTDAGTQFQVKRIAVNPGGRLSLQKHKYRAEHWVVVSGEATVTIDQNVTTVRPNEHVYIPLGAVHRLENFGCDPVELVEVQSGTYLGEDDIVRLEDVYNRA
jgi:mannose-1-phosphate guanylyltransferase / mannose-6-phosphate isomerase